MRRSRHFVELVILVAVVAVSAAVYRNSQPPPADDVPELGEGIRLYRAGQYARAVPYLSEVLRRQPTSVQAYVYRGMCRAAQGQVEAARADFDEGVKRTEPVFVQLLYPRMSVQVRVERARLAAGTGRYQDAIDDTTVALDSTQLQTLLPFDRLLNEAHSIRGLAHSGLKEYSQAQSDFYMASIFADEALQKLTQRHLAAVDVLSSGDEEPYSAPYYLGQSQGAKDDGCMLCVALRPHEAKLLAKLKK